MALEIELHDESLERVVKFRQLLGNHLQFNSLCSQLIGCLAL